MRWDDGVDAKTEDLVRLVASHSKSWHTSNALDVDLNLLWGQIVRKHLCPARFESTFPGKTSVGTYGS